MRSPFLTFAAFSLVGCQAAPPNAAMSGAAAETAMTPATAAPQETAAVPPAATGAPVVATAAPVAVADGELIGSGMLEEDIMAPPEPVDCAGVAEEATETLLPVDVIIVIDNSSSMSQEIIEVQNRINADFAQIMGASGLDYRVIMVARYGDVNEAVGASDHPICVGPPLGAAACTDAATATLANNPPTYFHYSSDIGSREPWCDLLSGFSGPDEDGAGMNDRAWTPLFPNGFSEHLRPEAFKHFLVITDDISECGVDIDAAPVGDAGSMGGRYDFDDGDDVQQGLTAAQEFDEALLALSPAQFGTAADRRYRWHSIVGMAAKGGPDGGVPEPWLPTEPVTTERCGEESVGAGTGFQQLSVLTGGLRYPSCFSENFNAVFNAIAEGIIEGAMLSCEWELPPAPDGQIFDKELVNVEFTSGAGVAAVVPKAASLEACAGAPGWYFDNEDAPTSILACPASCSQFQADMSGKVNIVFGCTTVVKGTF